MTNTDKRETDKLWDDEATRYRTHCPECGGKIETGFELEGRFRGTGYVPQQYGFAAACKKCRITWSRGATADL